MVSEHQIEGEGPSSPFREGALGLGQCCRNCKIWNDQTVVERDRCGLNHVAVSFISPRTHLAPAEFPAVPTTLAQSWTLGAVTAFYRTDPSGRRNAASLVESIRRPLRVRQLSLIEADNRHSPVTRSVLSWTSHTQSAGKWGGWCWWWWAASETASLPRLPNTEAN